MTTNKMTIESSTAHETADRVVETAKLSYLVVVISVLGVFAFITAVLVAWPGIAYIAAKLF